jgi:hypothetical protein
MNDSERRVSTTERQAAIAALQAHLTAGRLDSGEYEDRSVQARQARVRGDLEGLFADLPEPGPLWDEADSISSGAGTHPGRPINDPSVNNGPVTPQPATAASVPQRNGLVPEPWGAWVVSLTPFAALLLFFGAGHHWQWFLAIPIVGLLVYGPEGRHSGHPRNRNRNRRQGY